MELFPNPAGEILLEDATGSAAVSVVSDRALHGPGGPARPVWAGLYNFEKPSGRAGPGRVITGPGQLAYGPWPARSHATFLRSTSFPFAAAPAFLPPL